jgi:hypothetical protein
MKLVAVEFGTVVTAFEFFQNGQRMSLPFLMIPLPFRFQKLDKIQNFTRIGLGQSSNLLKNRLRYSHDISSAM